MITCLLEKRPDKRPADPRAALELLNKPIRRRARLGPMRGALSVVAPAVLGFVLFGGIDLLGGSEPHGSPDDGGAAANLPPPAVTLTAEERGMLEADYTATAEQLKQLRALASSLQGEERTRFDATMKEIGESMAVIRGKLGAAR